MKAFWKGFIAQWLLIFLFLAFLPILLVSSVIIAIRLYIAALSDVYHGGTEESFFETSDDNPVNNLVVGWYNHIKTLVENNR